MFGIQPVLYLLLYILPISIVEIIFDGSQVIFMAFTRLHEYQHTLMSVYDESIEDCQCRFLFFRYKIICAPAD